MGPEMTPKYWKTHIIAAIAVVIWLMAYASPALATQTHGEPEGLVVHQLAHIFFCASMIIFVYWLRHHQLDRSQGWKLIQAAAVFMALWNVDAMAAHFLDEQVSLIQVHLLDTWHIRIDTQPGYEPLVFWYYAFKLDHLLSVPALILLYLGLKRLAAESQSGTLEHTTHDAVIGSHTGH